MDWLDLLAVQGTLKSLLQHYSSKASMSWGSRISKFIERTDVEAETPIFWPPDAKS